MMKTRSRTKIEYSEYAVLRRHQQAAERKPRVDGVPDGDPAAQRPTTPAYPERAMAPVRTAEATRTILPTPALFIRSVFRSLHPSQGSEGPATGGYRP